MKSKMHLLMIFILTLSGCTNTNTAKSTNLDTKYHDVNLISENYYMAIVDFSIQVIKFDTNHAIEWVDCGLGRKEDIRIKYYGIYELNNRNLMIKLSGQDAIFCSVYKDGEIIIIDEIEFTKIDEGDLIQETINAFD